jgi:uncharacterized protein YecE (DUF72 family)
VNKVRTGTAGWAIPAAVADRFAADGSALERYASRFDAVEINSSFHRAHAPATWARWAASVPDDFRFAVKLAKAITHQARLVDCGEALDGFHGQVSALGDKLGVLLVQLPPSLAFDPAVAGSFFASARTRFACPVACEPRHPSWFDEDAEELLTEFRVARVAADPARVPAAGVAGGWPGLAYWRLHGSPTMYRSSYGGRIGDYARSIAASAAADRWCIFDNTASGAATSDALALQAELG